MRKETAHLACSTFHPSQSHSFRSRDCCLYHRSRNRCYRVWFPTGGEDTRILQAHTSQNLRHSLQAAWWREFSSALPFHIWKWFQKDCFLFVLDIFLRDVAHGGCLLSRKKVLRLAVWSTAHDCDFTRSSGEWQTHGFVQPVHWPHSLAQVSWQNVIVWIFSLSFSIKYLSLA